MSCEFCYYAHTHKGNIFEVTCKRFPQHLSKNKNEVCGEFKPLLGHYSYGDLRREFDVYVGLYEDEKQRRISLEKSLHALRKKLRQLKSNHAKE